MYKQIMWKHAIMDVQYKNMRDITDRYENNMNMEDIRQILSHVEKDSGKQLRNVLGQIYEYMEKEQDINTSLLLFSGIASCVDKKEDSDDILELLVFLATQKCRFMQLNLFALGEDMYTLYHDCICSLRYRVRFLLLPSHLVNMGEEDKLYLCHIYFVLMDIGIDGMLLFLHGLFNDGVVLQCPYCQHVHELPSLFCADQRQGEILPTHKEEYSGIYDAYFLFKKYVDRVKEENMRSLLPYLYGTYHCPYCEEDFSVMKGLQEYTKYHTYYLSAPTQEEMNFLLQHGISLREDESLEKATYYLQLLYGLQKLSNEDHEEAICITLLELARIYILKGDMIKTCATARYVLECLDDENQKELLGAKPYLIAFFCSV